MDIRSKNKSKDGNLSFSMKVPTNANGVNKVIKIKSGLGFQDVMMEKQQKYFQEINEKMDSLLKDLKKITQKDCLFNVFKILENCLINLTNLISVVIKDFGNKRLIVKKGKAAVPKVKKVLNWEIVKDSRLCFEGNKKEDKKFVNVIERKNMDIKKYKDWIDDNEWSKWPWFKKLMRRWNFSDSHQCLPLWEEKKLSVSQRQEFHRKKWNWQKDRIQVLLKKSNKVQIDKFLMGMHSRVIDGRRWTNLDKSFEKDIGINVEDFIKRKMNGKF